MTAADYLKPVLDAAALLGARIYPYQLEQLTVVLDKLSPRGFPMDVISKVDALTRLTKTDLAADGEELDILLSVFPDWNGSVNYRLTPTTLIRQWSAKHSGVYSTISVPFPTTLPLTFTVERFCDMDDLDNHGDECPQRYEEDDEEHYSESCDCVSYIEQTATLTVKTWDEKNTAKVRDWLSQAVIETVKNRTLA